MEKKEKKVIIALYGDPNTGKTTTLHKLSRVIEVDSNGRGSPSSLQI